MANKDSTMGVKSGVFTGKTSPGPMGSSHGIKQSKPDTSGSGATASFRSGPNDGMIVQPAKGKDK